MSENKDKHIQAKKTSEKKDEIEELKVFIKKKKIMAKLNTNENNADNKK